MAVISVEALRLDLAEANKLQDEATRKRVKDILLIEGEKIQAEIKQLEESTKKDKESGSESAAVKPKASSRPLKVITTYGWDQSEKFMKLYITLNGVQNIPKENIKCDFTDSGFELLVSDLDRKDHKVLITRLMEGILEEGSYFKVKTDMVLLMLKKAQAGKTWAYVTKKDDGKAKSGSSDAEKPPPPPQGQGGAEGQDGMMDMLKKMYDEGDDEMKRTIGKAMSENQRGGGGGGMPGMPGMGGMGGAGGMPGMGGMGGMPGMGGMGGMPGMGGAGGMPGMGGGGMGGMADLMAGLGGMGGMPGMGGAGGAPGTDGLGAMSGMPDMASLLSGLGGMAGMGGEAGLGGDADGTGSSGGI